MRLLLLASAALAIAASAAADIGLVEVAPSVARPGQLVRVRVAGFLPAELSMPVVLVRSTRIPRPYRCRPSAGSGGCEPIVGRSRLQRPPYRIVGFARRWVRECDRPGQAETVVVFRLPRVRPGRYRLALWCGPCARGTPGSLIAGPMLVVR